MAGVSPEVAICAIFALKYNPVIDPQTEAALFRDDVLKRFYASFETPTAMQATSPAQTEPPAWTAEMDLWAFASST